MPRRPKHDTEQASVDPGVAGRAFPGSLCHDCSAPPRYVVSDRGAVFIYCPVLRRYPPQPVLVCAEFEPRQDPER